jgi:hypothetical protein
MKYMLYLLLLLVSCSAWSDNAWQYSKQVERSMVVTGTITVNPDGSVQRYTLDRQDQLLPEIVELISGSVPTWKFQPMTGSSSPASATMNIRILADKLKGDQYTLRICGASFGVHGEDSDEWPHEKERKPVPKYPDDALQTGVGGTVYVVALINRQGAVEKVDAMQVNLRALGDKDIMKELRRSLARSALKAIANWTFTVPTKGLHVNDDHWMVRIPVNFLIDGRDSGTVSYGHWDAYVPGPVNHIPWLESEEHRAAGSADAIPDNDLAFQDDPRFVLLTPPSEG